MNLKTARQILKAFADDTRLRIINLLNTTDLTVTEICDILKKNQPNISKHLTRLRLTGIVTDKRDGVNVIYILNKPEDESYSLLLNSVTTGLSEVETFKKDKSKLLKYKEKTEQNNQ